MNPNHPAFPCDISMSDDGLTKREWLAGMAMGAAMQYASGDGRYDMNASDFAKSAVSYADALIKELSK